MLQQKEESPQLIKKRSSIFANIRQSASKPASNIKVIESKSTSKGEIPKTVAAPVPKAVVQRKPKPQERDTEFPARYQTFLVPSLNIVRQWNQVPTYHTLLKSEKTSSEMELKYSAARKYVSDIVAKINADSELAIDELVLSVILAQEETLTSLECHVRNGSADSNRAQDQKSFVGQLSQQTMAKSPSMFSNLLKLANFNIQNYNCGAESTAHASVMRKWDELGDLDRDKACQKYVDILNSNLPEWHSSSATFVPMSFQDRMWMLDQERQDCPVCTAPFSMLNRRHHCRRCFQLTCGPCSTSVEPLLLTPGGLIRHLRVCDACQPSLELEKALLSVKKQNLDLRQDIQQLKQQGQSDIQTKQLLVVHVRQLLIRFGSDVSVIDDAIEHRLTQWKKNQLAEKENDTSTNEEDEDEDAVVPFEEEDPDMNQAELDQVHAQLRRQLDKTSRHVCQVIDPLNVILNNLKSRVTPQFLNILKHCAQYCSLVDLVALAQTCTGWIVTCRNQGLFENHVLEQGLEPSVRNRFWLHSTFSPASPALATQMVPTFINPNNTLSSLQQKEVFDRVLVSVNSNEEHAAMVKIYASDIQRVIRRLNTENPALEASKSLMKQQQSLLRVIQVVNETIPYHRSMNFIIGAILSQNLWHEAQAYWIFMGSCVSPSYQLQGLYQIQVSDTSLLNLRLFQLTKLMKRNMPELYDHFLTFNLHPNVFAADWLTNCFMDFNTLSYPVALEVYDWFLLDGWKAVFRVILALISFVETQDNLYAFAFGEMITRLSALRDDPRVQNPKTLKSVAKKFKVTRRVLNDLQSEYVAEKGGDFVQPLERTPGQKSMKKQVDEPIDDDGIMDSIYAMCLQS